MIHNNDSLSAIETFFCLRTSLSEGIAKCIKNIETTAIMRNDLIARYNNKKLLIQMHVKAICDLPIIKEKSLSSLGQFLDNFVDTYQRCYARNWMRIQ